MAAKLQPVVIIGEMASGYMCICTHVNVNS